MQQVIAEMPQPPLALALLHFCTCSVSIVCGSVLLYIGYRHTPQHLASYSVLIRGYESHAEMNIIERNLFNPITPLFLGPMFGSNIGRTCEKMLAKPGLIERLRAEKYDVYIVENFEVCGIALFYAHLDVHSHFSRLTNLIGELFIRNQFWFPRRACEAALKKKFRDYYRSVAEQSSRIAYLFTNSEPLIETAAPTLSRVIDISQIGAREPQSLDEKWSVVLGRRPQAILVSFGSMVKIYLLPIETKRSILKMMSRFPNTTFIWKYEKPEDGFSRTEAAKVDNLLLTEWMPQIDILGMFHTIPTPPSALSSLMGSVQEAAARGVPGVFIPIFGDQPRNAGMMERNGFGLVYDKFALADKEKLTATVREVVENPKYRTNARRISRMLARKPFKPKEQLVKYVEFAAEFGPSPALRPQSHDMSFVAYHNLDIIAVFILISVISILIFVKVTGSIIRKLLCIVKVKKE